jgi:CysZ protein
LSLNFIDKITGAFFLNAPDTATIWGWLLHKGWIVLKWLYIFLSRIVAFYLAFALAYALTAPGYVLLSTATENIRAGRNADLDDNLSFRGVLVDLVEGIKIGGFGLLVTVAALFANFIPIIGQIVVLLLYTYYSALMFLDYPASRRRWTLARKLGWMSLHHRQSLRLGILPAVISMIPFVNMFLIALLFPFLTVHTTLNFIALESQANHQTTDEIHGHRD